MARLKTTHPSHHTFSIFILVIVVVTRFTDIQAPAVGDAPLEIQYVVTDGIFLGGGFGLFLGGHDREVVLEAMLDVFVFALYPKTYMKLVKPENTLMKPCNTSENKDFFGKTRGHFDVSVTRVVSIMVELELFIYDSKYNIHILTVYFFLRKRYHRFTNLEIMEMKIHPRNSLFYVTSSYTVKKYNQKRTFCLSYYKHFVHFSYVSQLPHVLLTLYTPI